MKLTRYNTIPKLGPYVHSYFLIETGKSENPTDIRSSGGMNNHPQGTVDLMFALSGGFDLTNYKGSSFQLNEIFIMGQQEGFFNIDFAPNTKLIGIVFYPESFRKLFALAPVDFVNKGEVVTNILDQPYRDLLDKMHDLGRMERIVPLLDFFFASQLAQVDYNFDPFDELVRNIQKSQMVYSVPDMIELLNVSERTLQRKMKQLIGISPKSFSKLNRFKRVLETINKRDELDWQDILHGYEFFDQAHFIKEFKRYTGATPVEFIKTNNLSKAFLKKG